MLAEGIVGLFLIILMEMGLVLKVHFFLVFATPVAWTGYILLVDYINFRLY